MYYTLGQNCLPLACLRAHRPYLNLNLGYLLKTYVAHKRMDDRVSRHSGPCHSDPGLNVKIKNSEKMTFRPIKNICS